MTAQNAWRRLPNKPLAVSMYRGIYFYRRHV
jgi:hypothetical protein